ncbi:MAG: DoxX family membrane protein [Bryobacteraceae bacterium]
MEAIQDRLSRKTPAGWKGASNCAAAALLAVLFLASGLWKMLDIQSAAERMVQSLVPAGISTGAAMLVGTGETFAAILLLVPRFRRWGALLAGLMLVAFLAYVGIYYHRLLGEDCNCFPWIRRVVGPAFFAGDAAMLLLAVVAGWGARRPHGLKAAGIVLAVVAAFTLCSYGIAAARDSRIVAPETIDADGHPMSIHEGRMLLYFFDPECTHCLGVAREMSRYHWQVPVIAIPTAQPRFATDFLRDAGLNAIVSRDTALLRRTFVFTSPPYAVALIGGRQAAAFNWGQLDQPSFYLDMRRLGFIGAPK